MTLNGSPENRNDLADRKSVRGARRRSLAVCLLVMLIAAVSRPEPALAQWDSVAGAVAGAMVRGMVGNGGGGRSRSHVAHARAKPTHVASHHEHAAPVHHASSGGHAASGGASEPAGPGGGSFH